MHVKASIPLKPREFMSDLFMTHLWPKKVYITHREFYSLFDVPSLT